MKKKQQSGFTLIELLMVCVIVGLVATVAVPSFMRARDAADTASAVAGLRSMHNNQTMYKFAHGRYARMNELNAFSGNSLGRTVGTTVRRGEFIFTMLPTPTISSLRTDFQIIGYRIRNGRVVTQYQIQAAGSIKPVLP